MPFHGHFLYLSYVWSLSVSKVVLPLFHSMVSRAVHLSSSRVKKGWREGDSPLSQSLCVSSSVCTCLATPRDLLLQAASHLSPLGLFCRMHACYQQGARGACCCVRQPPSACLLACALLPQGCLVNLSDASLLCFPSPATSHVARSDQAAGIQGRPAHASSSSPMHLLFHGCGCMARSSARSIAAAGSLSPACLFTYMCCKNQNYVLIGEGMHVVKRNHYSSLSLSL